ncbi:MAG: glycine betaine ABC transporter substrate-binding protein [Comamonadaceae bacterium]|nr:glycine betaine ABC transporter substrate-binding protein [Comamonadaceae bacterium]
MKRLLLQAACGLACGAALLLAGCDRAAPPAAGAAVNAPIRIATKPMTEQFILAEMLALLIERDGTLKAEIKKGIGGGTANIHPALLKGEFDLYPEYTGTAWQYVLKKSPLADEKALMDALTASYREQFGLEWVGLYGFNNTYGLAVRQALADQHRLQTYSDLAPLAGQLTFGAEYDFFEREDGYDALTRAYGLRFAKRVDMDIGLKYQAMRQGQIDVMNVFTTDGQLSAAGIQVLRDDKRFYPAYRASTVVRQDTLARHPALRGILMKMDGLLTDQDMARLNHAVESEGRNERDVAAAFLHTKGLLP